MPKPCDNKEMPACISAAVLEARANSAANEKKKLEKDLENEMEVLVSILQVEALYTS